MIYGILVNNKVVSTQYNITAVSKYLRRHHPNIRGTSRQSLLRNFIDGVFEKGNIQVVEIEDTQDIKRRGIPRSIRQVVRESEENQETFEYDRDFYISRLNYIDIIKFIFDFIQSKGEEFLRRNRVKVSFVSRPEQGIENSFGTRFLDYNSLYLKVYEIIEDYLNEYEGGEINLKRIGIRFLEVPPLEDLYIFKSTGEKEKEIIDDLLNRFTTDKKKITNILNNYDLKSPNTYKNCLIKAAYISKYSKEGKSIDAETIKNISKKFVERYKEEIKFNNLSNLGPLLSRALKVDIRVYFIDTEIKEFFYPYRQDEEIKILIKGSHSFALIKRNLEIEITDIDLEKKIDIPKFKDELKDYNISSYDLETCNLEEKSLSSDGKTHKNGTEVYAVGYYNGKTYKEIYKQTPDDNPLSDFLQYLYDEESGKRIIYAHNGGKFDTYLLIKEILKSNLFYITSFLDSNGRILNLTIRQNKKKGKEFIFRDSINLIACSLDKACKDFKPKTKKLTGDVNHNLININNCYTQEIYNYTAQYLKNDCLSLYEILEIFDKTIKKAYKFGIRESLTNAGIARRVFLSKFYKSKEKPLYTLDRETDRELRKFYFGGRNECMTKLGYNKGKFYYVDFTSLYPYVMSKYDYFFGEIEKIDLEEDTPFNYNWFGFVKVLFRHKNKTNIPFHPVVQESKLIFPYADNWTESIISTEDIKYSLENNLGYEYKFLKVYNWNKKDKYFKDIVEELYIMKLKSQKDGNKALRSISKIIINSLYGFFGINYLNRNQTLIINERVSNKKLNKEEIENKREEKRKARFYGYLLDQKLKDYKEVGQYDVYQIEDKIKAKCANVGIASLVCSYARLELYKLLKAIKDEGGNIYYMDTDSVITDLNIYKNPKFKSFIGSGGENLGELTNETDEEGGYYKELITLGNKAYALRNEDLKYNPLIIKLKGINSKQKYDIKEIDEKNKKVYYKSINKLEGKYKIGFDDYRLLAEGYNLICDNMNFISGVREMIIKDKGLIKLSNTKEIRQLYDKANLDKRNNITPLVI